MVSKRYDPTVWKHSDHQHAAEQWRRWEKQFAFYFAAAELNKKPKKTQVAILLHCVGPEVHDIYSNVVFSNNDDDRDTNWEHVLTIVNQEKTKFLKCTDSTNVINAINVINSLPTVDQ